MNEHNHATHILTLIEMLKFLKIIIFFKKQNFVKGISEILKNFFFGEMKISQLINYLINMCGSCQCITIYIYIYIYIYILLGWVLGMGIKIYLVFF